MTEYENGANTAWDIARELFSMDKETFEKVFGKRVNTREEAMKWIFDTKSVIDVAEAIRFHNDKEMKEAATEKHCHNCSNNKMCQRKESERVITPFGIGTIVKNEDGFVIRLDDGGVIKFRERIIR